MLLGILGGCGPAAGAHFYARLIALTEARGDFDHVDVLLSGRASTPDRTHAMLHGDKSPLRALLRDASLLADAGADLLALPCHTAHAYLPELRASLHIPILDMVALTVEDACRRGTRCLGVLCTEGTRRTGIYARAAAAYGVRVIYPSPSVQEQVNFLIYEVLKQGRTDFGAGIRTALADLAAQGCDAVSLSCTELSLPATMVPPRLYSWHGVMREIPVIDPIELLAKCAIIACGKRPKEEEKKNAAFEFTFGSHSRSPARGRMG